MARGDTSTRSYHDPISNADRAHLHSSLKDLAREFEGSVDALRASASATTIADMRSLMSEAGATLLRLLNRKVVPMPSAPPRWLDWWLSSSPRPRFVAHRNGSCLNGNWWPTKGLRGLGYTLNHRMRSQPGKDHVPLNESGSEFVRRQIFVEALSGWLGRASGVRQTISLPTIEIGLTTGFDNAQVEQWQEVSRDWVNDGDQEHLLFLQLGRASTAVCRHWASRLDTPADSTEPDGDHDNHNASDRILVGWQQILGELGLSPKGRLDRDRVKRLNKELDGPIQQHGQRGVITNGGRLLAWWRSLDQRAREAADQRAQQDTAERSRDSYLENPGVRRDIGFHDRAHPNKKKRRK